MPFNPNNNPAAAVAPSFNDNETEDFSISPEAFQYAIVTDARGTDLLSEGEVYPIAFSVKKGFKQAVGGQQAQLRFDAPVVYLLGVTNRKGNPAMPYSWDTRRFSIVSFDELTDEQKENALSCF